MKKLITYAEKQASSQQMLIKNLLGRVVTREEALAALKLNREGGDGGNTIGWKFDRVVNGELTCNHKQHTVLGDMLCNLGKLTEEHPTLKWCFPETYKHYKRPNPQVIKDLSVVSF
jgi:hypothetical protein